MTPHSTDPVYLDHAATTPMRPEAIAAMVEELGHLGNPSSLHAAGRRARRVVEESREQLAEVFGARPSEVIFTSGGTEADNLAVKGLYWARRGGSRRRVLTTSVEHHAVLDSVRWLEEAHGAEAIWLAVGDDAMILPGALRAAIAPAPEQVAVVSVMWANNEVGAVQPVGELAEVAHEYGVPFHTDAVQAAAQIPVDFAASGADALTVTGHKLGGLHRVGVKRHAVLVRHRGQFADRQHRAHLVVRPHHADHGDVLGGLRDRGAQLGRADHAVVADRQPDGFGALGLLQPPDRVQHGVMLDRGGQHAAPPSTRGSPVPARPVQALHREVVRLGPAAGEDDLARPGAEHLGELLPGLLHHPPGAAARGVQ